jgi:hypothetical protein
VAGRLECRGQISQGGKRARRQFDHPAHQVDSPDLFGDAMLDLQARVHFEEIELLRGAVVDEFDRARRAVLHRFGEFDRGFAKRFRHAVRQTWRGRFLQHLLVTPLHGAVAYAERNRVAAAIAEHLDFEMPCPLDVLLDEHARITEVVLAEALHHIEIRIEFSGVPADTHADAATARGAFQHDRVADSFSGLQRGVHVLEKPRAFEHRYALFRCDRAGRVLQAEGAKLRRRGSNKRDARCFARFTKLRVLREKTVAGMDRLHVLAARDVEDLGGVQIGGGCRSVAETVRNRASLTCRLARSASA